MNSIHRKFHTIYSAKVIVPATFLAVISIFLLGFLYQDFLDLLNLGVLALTLAILVWYAHDTHRIANQTTEANLRPVILRSGYIESWDDVLPYQEGGTLIDNNIISFSVCKNIAANITGYFVWEGKKYTLLFGHNITNRNGRYYFTERWGWLKPGEVLSAVFNESRCEDTDAMDEIVLNYTDVEGNRYITIENRDFRQESFKV